MLVFCTLVLEPNVPSRALRSFDIAYLSKVHDFDLIFAKQKLKFQYTTSVIRTVGCFRQLEI